LLVTYGIFKYLPIYKITAPSVSDDTEANTRMRDAITPLFLNPRFITNAYKNTDPVTDETLLILSDSYGNLASEMYAHAFRRVLQVMANDTKPDTAAEMIRRIRETTKIDRVLVLMQEGNTDRIVEYAATFDKDPTIHEHR
jgi:hypothetical protein